MVDPEEGIEAAESITQVCSMLCEKHREGRKWDRTADELFDSICRVLKPSHSQRAARSKALLNLSLLLEGQEVEFEASDWLVSAECSFQLYGSCRMGTDLGVSDLDLTVHASITMTPATAPLQEPRSLILSELPPEQKAAFMKRLLHSMADIIEDSGAVRGKVVRILGRKARVPLLRFEEAETGVVCDVSCTNDGPVIKSETLKNVMEIDERAVHLVRLVKQWARLHGINDGSQGTFNSYALTNMALYHLQAQPQPVVPPLAMLMPPDLLAPPEDAPSSSQSRASDSGTRLPLVRGELPQSAIDAASESMGSIQARCKTLAKQGYGQDNTSSMAQLFASFIVRFMVVTRAWSRESGEGVAVSSFEGKLVCADESLHGYAMIVEDPFDTKINVARSVRGNLGRQQGFKRASMKIGNAFEQTSKALAEMRTALRSQSTTHDMITSMFGSSIADDIFEGQVDEDRPSASTDAKSGQGKGRGKGTAGQQQQKRSEAKKSSPDLAKSACTAGKQVARRKGVVASALRAHGLSETPKRSPVWSTSSLLGTGRALHFGSSSLSEVNVHSVHDGARQVQCPCGHIFNSAFEDSSVAYMVCEVQAPLPPSITPEFDRVLQGRRKSYAVGGARSRIGQRQWTCQSAGSVKRMFRL